MNVVVIGIGNAYRCDDGVAFHVLSYLRDVAPSAARYVELDGESFRLIDAWDGADLAIIIDACQSGSPPGTVHRVDLDQHRLPARPGVVSGHAAGIAEAVHLARVLERLPRRLVAIAVEAADLGHGTGLSAVVAAAVPAAARTVLDDIKATCAPSER